MTDSDPRQDPLGDLIRTVGKRPAPSEEDRRRVFAAARDAWQAKVRARSRRRWIYASAASIAAAAAVGIGLQSWLEPGAPAATVVRLAGPVEIRPTGEDAWRALDTAYASVSAGARVRTASEGRVSFDLRGVSLRVDRETAIVFDSRDRVTLEEGTLYVDSGVGRGDARIEVATPYGVLEDIGTQFEVRSAESTLRLRVREGRVRLEPRNLPDAVESAAGEEVALTPSGEVRRRDFPPVHADWAWAEALAETPDLDGRTAHDLLRWVARETGRRLVFADAVAELRARNAVLGGRGPYRALSPLEVLEIAVGTADGLEYTLNGDVLLVRGR